MSLTTKEIAAGIDAHLRRFAEDKELNNPRTQFWTPAASASSGWVHVMYVSYQGATALRKAQAIAYLDALDAGYVGKHWHIPKTNAARAINAKHA